MRKKILGIVAIMLMAAAVYVFVGAHAGIAQEAEKAPAVVAKEVKEKAPTFNGIAYIAGHGGHLAIIDLRTEKSPTDASTDRIVLTEAGGEMEGVVAGMKFEQVKAGGGTHGQALVSEGGKKYMIAGMLNGKVYKVDMTTGKKEGPFDVGQKFCGAILGPDGNIYFEDMADGNIYVWDPVKLKTVDKMPVGAALCGIQWTKNDKKAYITDMPTGIVYVYDWTTKKKIKEIKSPEMTFIHQERMTPDGKYLWVAAPNEYDPGLKPGTHRSQIIVIDTATDEIVKRIVLPEDIRPHDFAFVPKDRGDKYALLSSRTYGNDSVMAIYDIKKDEIVARVSACASCHDANGVKVSMDKGSPLLCGITVDWNPSK